MRGFGFIKFFTLQHAQDFMKRWASSFSVGHSRIRVAYSNKSVNHRDSQRRNCPSCGMMNDAHHESCHLFMSGKQGGGPMESRGSRGYMQRLDQPTERSRYQQQQFSAALSQMGQQAQYPYHHASSAMPALNIGARDIGQVPNTILIVRDLPSMVIESSLWNAMSSLGPLRRVMLAKDRQSKISWGFCFAEYDNLEESTKALEKANSGSFLIQAKPVEVNYAHYGSFIPAYAPTQWTIPFGGEDKLAIYWDEQAYLSVYTDFSAQTAATQRKTSASGDLSSVLPKPKETDELEAFYASMGDVLSSGSTKDSASSIFSIPTAAVPVSNSTTVAPTRSPPPVPIVQELPTIPTTAKADEAQLAGLAAAQAAEQLAKSEEKKRKAGHLSVGMGGGKKVSIQLQKWSTRQVELKKGEEQSAETSQQSTQPETVPALPNAPPTQDSQDQLSTSYEPDELLDLSLVACLLCQRRFKIEQDLRKHVALSDLHKKNLEDPEAIQNALRKSRGGDATDSSAASNAPKSSLSKSDEEPRYRDRAAERRQIYGQPNYPLPPIPQGRSEAGYGGPGGARSGYGHGHAQEVTIIPEQPTKDGIKDDNIGNRLLKSMGWKEGQGLGKDGEGIKAPIEASSYGQGVGIGAGLLRKADGASQTRGPLGNYAETAKDLARRRYEQSGGGQ
ncbi:hypothetical protein BGW38_005717 [Lunasporangiospora selenospora]|uniref:G-patch domain-containing protein n=1 Tax=Lunasporangiospora selenospora TaxID=979761 RepID=A0A9P6KH16_9FUNG|nr:hypothetical protein BGW38_005717 [Lunasporangiospora selenospora]